MKKEERENQKRKQKIREKKTNNRKGEEKKRKQKTATERRERRQKSNFALLDLKYMVKAIATTQTNTTKIQYHNALKTLLVPRRYWSTHGGSGKTGSSF